ncbi:MAG: hypothetical protein ABI700_12885, partial [Chloroflexota bacterium]
MRTRLELALKPYNIQLVRTGDNLQFSFAGASGIDQDTITNLVVKAAETEIAGPWMFTFDVPPAL